MTTVIYPIQDPSTALNEEHKVSILELAWLLSDLSTSTKSLVDGIEECLALLQSDQPGSTLVLSSNRSEALKGFVLRVGQNIVKADIHLKLSSLSKGQVCSFSLAEGRVIPLAQLGDCANFLAVCLRVINEMDFVEPALVLAQLRKLLSNIRYAHISIRNVSPAFHFPFTTIESNTFTPELPDTVALDLIISESGVIADVRTLHPIEPPQDSGNASIISSSSNISRYRQSSMSGGSSIFRGGSTKSVAAIAGGGSITPRGQPLPATSQPPMPDLTRTPTNVSTSSSIASTFSNKSTASTSSWFGSILGRKRQIDPSNTFVYKGQYVKSLERITVQSFDPGLMALISKLNVLELNIGLALRKLEIAMNWK
ncbi:RAVE subunit 2/Rogdi [Lipomyces kononenkoae]|uniref:RAVE subunit 2/Rogdi n=1 Tax=Lipomyces kononenkoae TaxID=34357 RepID=A0ACC3TBJ4_LIPKO